MHRLLRALKQLWPLLLGWAVLGAAAYVVLYYWYWR
jgi:hypothetical protein